MPSRSQEYLTQASGSSTRDMEGHLPSRHPSLGSHVTSNSVLELPSGQSDWGLATYSHDRGHNLETRTFSFQGDQVRSVAYNRTHPRDRDPGVSARSLNHLIPS